MNLELLALRVPTNTINRFNRTMVLIKLSKAGHDTQNMTETELDYQWMLEGSREVLTIEGGYDVAAFVGREDELVKEVAKIWKADQPAITTLLRKAATLKRQKR